MRRLVPSLAAAALALLVFAAAAPGAARLYAPAYDSNDPQLIHAYDRNADGSLTPIAGSPFPGWAPTSGVGGLLSFAFAPDGTRAVASFLGNGGVLGYSLNAAGAIAPTNAITTRQTENLAVTPDGRFAYIATREYPPASGAEGIRAFALGADGSLSPLPGSYDSATSFCCETAITPDGRFLYAGTGGVLKGFAINADGSLTPLAGTVSIGFPYLAISSLGPFLIALDTSAGALHSYTVNADGSLSENGPPAPTVSTSLDRMSVGPDGRHVYVTDANANEITVFAVAADGRLSKAGAMPVDDPMATAVSPDGRFLYWSRSADAIHTAAIGPDGIPTPLPFATPWDSIEPMHLLFQPGPAPVASFTAKAAAPGAAASFNAAKSTNAAVYDWDFGDGTTLANGGPKPSHAFAKPGKYTVTLSLTDAQGCGAKQIYTGQSTTCPGGAATTKALTVDTLPVIGKVKATPKKFLPAGVAAKGKGGTKFRVKLNEKAKIGLKIERRLPGRKVGRKCKKPTPGNASKKKCNRYVKLGSRNKPGKAGWTAIAFNGKLKGKPLEPGGYRITAVATDSAKGRSAPKTAAFRVLPY